MGPPAPIEQERDHVYGFDFNTGKQLFPRLGQIRPSIIKPDYKNFAPRLGFAYNPDWLQSVVFRGGIGTYFDQTQMNETQFITNGPPIFTQQNINLTGRGLPEYEFGRNTLPVVTIPPSTPTTLRREAPTFLRRRSTAVSRASTCGRSRYRNPSGGTGWLKPPMSAPRDAGCRNATTPMQMRPRVFFTTSPLAWRRGIRS